MCNRKTERRRGKSPYRLGPSVPPLRKRKSERRSVISFFVRLSVCLYPTYLFFLSALFTEIEREKSSWKSHHAIVYLCVRLSLVIFSFLFFHSPILTRDMDGRMNGWMGRRIGLLRTRTRDGQKEKF
jgi:hypothetical protein